MPDIEVKLPPAPEIKTERPKLHKVILVNDDYTPREFVITVLKAVFRMTADHAQLDKTRRPTG